MSFLRLYTFSTCGCLNCFRFLLNILKTFVSWYWFDRRCACRYMRSSSSGFRQLRFFSKELGFVHNVRNNCIEDLPPKWSISKKKRRHVRWSKGTQEAEPGCWTSEPLALPVTPSMSLHSNYWTMHEPGTLVLAFSPCQTAASSEVKHARAGKEDAAPTATSIWASVALGLL